MLWGDTNSVVYDRLSEYISGHDALKKALIGLANRSQFRYDQKWFKGVNEDYLLPSSKLLILGPSGTGKTYSVESLVKIVRMLLVRVDATKFNPTGASGGIKESDLRKLIVDNAIKAHEQFPRIYYSVEEAIDQTVVFVDEIDKLGAAFDSSGKWNSHVQSNFLTLLDNKAEF
jgi:ATP-dependent Clp protease ATP-binding subunit ClpX